jgi:hypothetical protein
MSPLSLQHIISSSCSRPPNTDGNVLNKHHQQLTRGVPPAWELFMRLTCHHKKKTILARCHFGSQALADFFFFWGGGGG